MPNIYKQMNQFYDAIITCYCRKEPGERRGVCPNCKNKGFIMPTRDRHIYLIGAMSKNRVIGKDNKLPWKIPDDLKYFKKMTKGKPVIMGRKTFDSIGKALPDRRNIVLSKNPDLKIPDVTVKNNIEDAILSCWPNEQIMIIGGSEIYAEAMPYAKVIYLTVIDEEYDGDAYFPEFEGDEWEKIEEVMHIDSEPWFSFNTFKRI